MPPAASAGPSRVSLPSPSLLTIGTFDLFHRGHVRFLANCARLGHVTVALNRDPFVERFKGKPPLLNLAERFEVVRACRYVSDCLVNSGDEHAQHIIELVSPSILAIGTDWATRDYLRQLHLRDGWLEDRGILLVYLPYTSDISSSSIRARL